MLRILGQKCPAFWCMWTRRRECSPAPREVSYRTEQALWMEEWKDRQNSGPDWHPWVAEPTTPGTSASDGLLLSAKDSRRQLRLGSYSQLRSRWASLESPDRDACWVCRPFWEGHLLQAVLLPASQPDRSAADFPFIGCLPSGNEMLVPPQQWQRETTQGDPSKCMSCC